MTALRVFVVDAFTRARFAGNPAAVVPLDAWLPDETLQRIAAEMNLSETAFFVHEDDGFRLRWMTPKTEVDLCGHATLASGHVVLRMLEPKREDVSFATRSGALAVSRAGERLAMDFPSRPPRAVDVHETCARALGGKPRSFVRARDLVAIYGTAEEVRSLRPDLAAIAALEGEFAVAATAPGDSPDVDFVSRFFAPAKGVPEDPVTGSLHCTLTPYWAERLGKTSLSARQVGPRGGELACTLKGDRVELAGHAVLVLEGTLHV
jgi:predicted PhzF superfamily epimerase YddE/YHI9